MRLLNQIQKIRLPGPIYIEKIINSQLLPFCFLSLAFPVRGRHCLVRSKGWICHFLHSVIGSGEDALINVVLLKTIFFPFELNLFLS
jgi:hypothetical protein